MGGKSSKIAITPGSQNTAPLKSPVTRLEGIKETGSIESIPQVDAAGEEKVEELADVTAATLPAVDETAEPKKPEEDKSLNGLLPVGQTDHQEATNHVPETIQSVSEGVEQEVVLGCTSQNEQQSLEKDAKAQLREVSVDSQSGVDCGTAPPPTSNGLHEKINGEYFSESENSEKENILNKSNAVLANGLTENLGNLEVDAGARIHG